MGMTDAPEKCFITDQPTENISSGKDCIQYYVVYNNERYFFEFHWNHTNSKFVNKNKYILQGLLLNKKFGYDKNKPNYENDRLEKIIKEANIPRLPKQKLDNLINYLHSAQIYEGSIIDFLMEMNEELLVKKLYFKNYQEYIFYLKTLKDYGFVDFKEISTFDAYDIADLSITYSGQEYVIELEDSGDKSNNCFIAMSFSESTSELRESLKLAIRECGYNPIIVDEIHYDSDVTINDAIISNIKKCKFLIADFTEQKHGVYFEAGYALGKNKPVIYLCNKSDFKNTHFDTNHYPHIVYETNEELIEKLKAKVSAWID